MTLDGFLAVLALLVAVYAAMPEIGRLRLQLIIRSTVVTGILGIGLVLYLQLFDVLGQPCPPSIDDLCKPLVFRTGETITPAQASFLVALAWLVWFGFMSRRQRVGRGALPALGRIVAELAVEQRFNEIIALVRPQLTGAAHIAEKGTRWSRLRKRLDEARLWKTNPQAAKILIDLEQAESSAAELKKQSWLERLAWLAPVVPDNRHVVAAADNLLSVSLSTKEFTSYIAAHRPDFGAECLALEASDVFDFSHEYLAALIARPGSSLYRELETSQNVSSAGVYFIPDGNRLLTCLFKDAKVAERLGVWEPIGEHVIAKLNPVIEPAYAASLLLPAERFHEVDKWRDPTFAAIQFFDIMIGAAAHQGIQWHMWLYYMPHFVDRLVTIHKTSGSGVDPDAEWPTRSAYLLYSVVDALRGWVLLVEDLPADSPHRELESEASVHENGNIPKSAAIALGASLRTILKSPRIDDRFAQYLHDIALRAIDRLQGQEVAPFRRTLINAIIAGGHYHGDADYQERLVELFNDVDLMLRTRLSDYEDALKG